MSERLINFISRLQDPADSIMVAKKFGLNITDTEILGMAGNRQEPRFQDGNPPAQDDANTIKNTHDYYERLNASRRAAGLPEIPVDEQVPAFPEVRNDDCIIKTEEEFMNMVNRAKAEKGMDV